MREGTVLLQISLGIFEWTCYSGITRLVCIYLATTPPLIGQVEALLFLALRSRAKVCSLPGFKGGNVHGRALDEI